MTHRTVKGALALVVAASCAAPLAASAQFFYAVQGTIDPPTCTTTSAIGTATGSLVFNLPAASPNTGYTIRVDGTLVASETLTNSSSGGFPFSGYNLSFPTQAFPFTVVAEQFPLLNGQPSGLGVRITAVCPAAGPGTATLESYRAGPGVAIPTLADAALVAMSALLALAAFVTLRRRGA